MDLRHSGLAQCSDQMTRSCSLVSSHLGVGEARYVLQSAPVGSDNSEDLLPAPVLDLLVEAEEQHHPLQGRRGGLSPGQQEVEETDGEVVLVEPLVLLHGGQVNVNEVPGVLFVQRGAVFDYLI